MEKYIDFLRSKIEIAPEDGFLVPLTEINPILKFHQRDTVQWAIRGGRRAIFKAFGLGKTLVDLEICRIIIKYKNGKALIILPLGVRQEFVHDIVTELSSWELIISSTTLSRLSIGFTVSFRPSRLKLTSFIPRVSGKSCRLY